jgi:predicted CoA-binding protein
MSSELNGTDGGWTNLPSDSIKRLLQESRTIAVVGLSTKPERPSNGVAAYLQKRGYQIIPINPGKTEILGEKCYPGLKEILLAVDIVDVFRRGDQVLPIVEEAIFIGAKAVWLQESIISTEAFKKGEKAGLVMVMDRCML